MTAGVYSIYCSATGDRFIGIAKDIETKWQTIRLFLNEGRWYSNHHNKIVDDWRTYGDGVFWWGILEAIPLNLYPEISYKRKLFWVDTLKPSYNEFEGCPKICGIYVIKNKVTGECYVGASVNVYKRIDGHFNMLKNGGHTSKPLHHSYQKYGQEAFEWEILEVCNERERLNLEKIWAHRLNATLNGFLPVKNKDLITWKRRKA